MYVADRARGRVQVYSLGGEFKRSFAQDFMISPSAFAPYGEFLIVAELDARLIVLDSNDKLVQLGDNLEVTETPGWPNMLDEHGVSTRTDRLRPGRFNSPHGLATDADGNIYVSESLIGGRYNKLSKAS